LHGARLRFARNLTQAQLDSAHGDRSTTLPSNLAIPEHWLRDEEARNSQLEKHISDLAGSINDPYARLGVSRKASSREIRAAYVRLVKELHPDAHTHNPATLELLKDINRAYQDLKDLAKAPVSRPPKTDFRHPSVVFVGSFLVSTALILVTFAGLFYAGFFAPPRPTLVAVNAETKEAAGPSGPVVAHSADAAADDAAWAEAERQGTSASLHRYLGRFSTGRHASVATERLAMVVLTEAAVRKPPNLQHRAALTEARTSLSRYLEVFPEGQLASEVRASMAAIESAESVFLAERAGPEVALVEHLDAHPKSVSQRVGKTPNAIDAIEFGQLAVDGDSTVARQADSNQKLRTHLDANADSAEANAGQLFAAIETAEVTRRRDNDAWAAAQQAGTSEAFRLYLDTYPDGLSVPSALQVLASIAAADHELRRDESDWSKAQRQNTRNAFSGYLSAHPNGRHVEIARARIANLDREARMGLPGGFKAAKQAAPTAGVGKANAPANARWPSADEPFIGADGRIR
jgi:DnaJ domain